MKESTTTCVNLFADNSGTYQYDLLNRLIGETKAPYGNQYGYDPVGNRLSQTHSDNLASTASSQAHQYGDTSNRLVSKNGISQSYDAVGNIVNDGSHGFSYDVANRLAAVTQGASTLASYRHNGLGQRASKTRPNSSNARSAAYLYNPAGQLLSETTYNDLGTVQQTKHYIWLGTVPIAMLQPAANDADDRVIYLHPDHLDTPRKATNQNQHLVWQWQSDAFGQTAANDDPDNDGTVTTINLRFPGQYYDVETGLHYNYFRDYDPSIGRYVQSDPIGLYDGTNTYAYAYASPLVNSDPTGEFVPMLVGAAIGAGLEYLTNPCASVSDILLAGAIGAVGGGVSGKLALRFGARSLTRVHGKVWSHSISRKTVNRLTKGSLNKLLNRRGGLNGSWVNPTRHHLHDMAATIKGGGRKLPLPLRGLDRIPDWLKGASASGAVGAGISGSGSADGCDDECSK